MTDKLDFTRRLSILDQDIARERASELRIDVIEKRVRDLRAEAEAEIVEDLQASWNAAAAGVERAQKALNTVTMAALIPDDPARYQAITNSITADLSLAPDDPIAGQSPLQRAAHLAGLAENAGKDYRLALAAAVASVGGGWNRERSAGLKRQLHAMTTRTPEIVAAEHDLQAAQGEVEKVRGAASRVGQVLDVSDARSAMAAGQPSRIQRLVAGQPDSLFRT